MKTNDLIQFMLFWKNERDRTNNLKDYEYCQNKLNEFRKQALDSLQSEQNFNSVNSGIKLYERILGIK